MVHLCQVQCCTSPHTHLTSAHVCANCWQLGHGIGECGPGLWPRLRRDKLMRSVPEESLPTELHCTATGCPAPETHTTAAHFCPRCLSWGGRCLWPCVQSVVREPDKITCPICRAKCTAVMDQPLFTGKECCICMAETKLFALAPCGHAQTCRACISSLYGRTTVTSEEN